MEPACSGITQLELDVFIQLLFKSDARFFFHLVFDARFYASDLMLIQLVLHLAVAEESSFCIVGPDLLIAAEALTTDHFEKGLLLALDRYALAAMEALIIE